MVRELDSVPKRRKTYTSRLNVSLEGKLAYMSGKVYEMYPKSVAEGGTAKKKDDAPVPVELWLYWLNAGLSYSFSLEDWRKSVVVLQEKFLLLRWRRNVMKSFGVWMKERLNSVSRGSREITIDSLVVKESQGWRWKKGG